MRFGFMQHLRMEAQPGLSGLCCACGGAVIAKCGTQRIWHWAHVKRVNCDDWWEPETEWHRAWKSNFPEDWQEYVSTDELTGERHIADVRTDKGLVIEFQHSHLVPRERVAREAFYRHMVWVVDGTRLKRDEKRFEKRGNYCNILKPRLYWMNCPELFFHRAWVNSKVPVIFDFGRESIWCLFPGRVGRTARFSELSPKAFINAVHTGDWSTRSLNFMEEMVLEDHKLKNQYDAREDLTDSNVARLLARRRAGRK
jgi:competence protein CoiA